MRTLPQRDGHEPTASATSPQANLKRRRFLLALGAGSAATAAATQALAAPVAAATAAAPEQASGYRETEHVRHYYATTRI